MAEYRVQFEVFEGPLDLLLYLVKKQEVDIYQVNLTQIASEFIEYIDVMRQMDLEVAGEFLVMAATLVYIKSRELLPREQRAEVDDGEEEAEDPRWELIRQLVEYKKFKEAAEGLQHREWAQDTIYPRRPGKPELEPLPPSNPEGVSIFKLIDAVNKVLQRYLDRPAADEIVDERWTVSEKIDLLRRRMTVQGRFRFEDLFAGDRSRTEVVVTFLALLELIRLKVATVEQSENFGAIEICRREADLDGRADESEDGSTVQAGSDGPRPDEFGLDNSETSFSH